MLQASSRQFCCFLLFSVCNRLGLGEGVPSFSDLSSGPVQGQVEARAAHLELLLKICRHSSGLCSLEHPPFPPAMSTRCTLWGAWPAGQVTLASEAAEAGGHFHRERKGPVRGPHIVRATEADASQVSTVQLCRRVWNLNVSSGNTP